LDTRYTAPRYTHVLFLSHILIRALVFIPLNASNLFMLACLVAPLRLVFHVFWKLLFFSTSLS